VRLFGVVEQFAQRLDIVERRLDLREHGTTWVDAVAGELGLVERNAALPGHTHDLLRGPLPSAARPAATHPLTPA
jgi:hypothetical protein